MLLINFPGGIVCKELPVMWNTNTSWFESSFFPATSLRLALWDGKDIALMQVIQALHSIQHLPSP